MPTIFLYPLSNPVSCYSLGFLHMKRGRKGDTKVPEYRTEIRALRAIFLGYEEEMCQNGLLKAKKDREAVEWSESLGKNGYFCSNCINISFALTKQIPQNNKQTRKKARQANFFGASPIWQHEFIALCENVRLQLETGTNTPSPPNKIWKHGPLNLSGVF